MLEKIVRNRFVQVLTFTSVLSFSAPAIAEPEVKPKKDYTLKLDLREKEYQLPKLELRLADSKCPPYLSPEECNKKSKKRDKKKEYDSKEKKKGPCPPYLCPEQYEGERDSQVSPIPEKPIAPKKSSVPNYSSSSDSNDVWGYVLTSLGVVVILAGGLTSATTVCHDNKCETYWKGGVAIMAGGAAVTGLGLYFVFD